MLKTIKKYNRDPYALDNQLLHFHNTSDLNINYSKRKPTVRWNNGLV